MNSSEEFPRDAASISRLPDSVWESIVNRLRTHHRAKLRGANRKFRTLVNNTVTKIKLDPTHSEDALQWQLHSRFPALTHIEVMKPSEVDCFTDQTFAQLALKDLSRLSGLTSLNLENCTQLTVAGMAALALACPRVNRLVIPQVCQLCMSDAMLLVLARLPELTKLRVQCCKHCDEVALAYLSDLRRLTALELEDYGQALRQVTQLTSLTSLRSVMVWSDYTVEVLDVGDVGAGGGGAGGGGGGPIGPAGPGGGGGGGGGGGPHGHPVGPGLAGLGLMHPAHGAHAGAGGGGGGVGLGALLAGGGGGGGGGVGGGLGGAAAGLHHHAQAAPAAGVNQMMAAAEAAAAAAALANMNLLQHAEGAAGPAAAAAAAAGAGGQAAAAAAGPGEDGGGGGGGDIAAAAAAAAAAFQNVDAAFVHQLQLTEQVLSNIFAGKAALLDWVTGMTGLTHVDIQRVDINAGELQRFSALPGLLHLGVGDLNLDGGAAGDTRAGGELHLPRPLTSVTKLVSHNILHEAHLRTTFPSLRALSCDSADEGLSHIAELTGLVNLFLWNSPHGSISDAGLAVLSGLRRLETFRLEGSEAVTGGGWKRFAAGKSSLTRVDLVKCPNISDIGFILSLCDLTRLERVSFVEIPLLDTRTLAALLTTCPRLEHLELQDCAAVSLAPLRDLLSDADRPDLELVYRKGGSMRTLYGSR